jgi:hypothetical protein
VDGNFYKHAAPNGADAHIGKVKGEFPWKILAAREQVRPLHCRVFIGIAAGSALRASRLCVKFPAQM